MSRFKMSRSKNITSPHTFFTIPRTKQQKITEIQVKVYKSKKFKLCMFQK